MVTAQIIYSAIFIFGSKWLAAGADDVTDSPRYIEYLDCESNTTRVIDLRGRPDPTVLTRAGTKDPNTYLLYTRENPTKAQTLFYNIPSTVEQSNFNPLDQTVVIVHGWKGDRHAPLNAAIRDAYLSMMYANIIVLEWSKLAASNYITATLGVPQAGRSLGQFLQFLIAAAGASFNNMHLIGFSLGAHVVGNAGKYLAGRLARITGLDPAGPLWNFNPDRLNDSHASYVEAIHTNSNLLGTNRRSGHVDFYPNRGTQQPGCLALTSCSHQRSWQLFAATLQYNHLLGRRCESKWAFDLDICFGKRLHMGNDDLLKQGSGKYTLKTDSEYPYKQIGCNC